jgi:hypothetical protein
LASVSADDVRDVINITAMDIDDAKITKMIARAVATLEGELDREIDYSDCTELEKEFITVLAAIYAICYLTGGSAVGLNFSAGSYSESLAGNLPSLTVLQAELERILAKLKGSYLGSA